MCREIRKYIDVQFVCQQTSLTYQISSLCDGDSLTLSCIKSEDRIVIFDGSFMIPENGLVNCPERSSFHFLKDAKATLRKSCDKTYVTTALFKKCHGREKCDVKANPQQLNAPKCKYLNALLSVKHACMNKVSDVI